MTIITNGDLTVLRAIKARLDKLVCVDNKTINWDISNESEVLDRVIHNLDNIHNYYKKLPDGEINWYDAECGKCGWFGSSEYLNGGGAIADTGDYFDVTCPICNTPI